MVKQVLLKTTGGSVAVREAGSGPAIVFLHGWGGSSRYWLHTAGAFAQDRRVIALDLPGFGATPPNGSASYGSLAATALAAADALGLDRFTVVGHSLGAGVALLMAAAAPQRVERLGLVSFGIAHDAFQATIAAGVGVQFDLAARLWGPWLALSRPWLTLTRPARQVAALTPPVPYLLAAPYVHQYPPPAALALGVADLIAMDPLAALESAASIGDPRLNAALPQATMPALVLGGRQDRIFPPGSLISLAASLPDAQLQLIDNCGHVPMVERPAESEAALKAFLA
jgi:pimeloyl-ACP methyl ester carboxylesterase